MNKIWSRIDQSNVHHQHPEIQEWLPLSQYTPPFGSVIIVRHNGYRPAHFQFEHRANVYKGDDVNWDLGEFEKDG